MKKVNCIIAFLAALIIVCSACNAASADSETLVLWTKMQNGYIHYYEDCMVLQQEAAYEIIQGSTDQAVAAGKTAVCIMCAARKYSTVDLDMKTVGQYLFSTMSDDELAYFSAVCNAELSRRHADPIILQPGVYVAGQDIPAGAYRLELVNGQNEYLAVYRNQEEYSSDFKIALFEKMFSVYLEDTIAGRVPLEVGNVLLLQGTFKLSPFAGDAP